MSITTSAGRVVYHRKPHIFATKDVVRVVRKVLVVNKIRGVTPVAEFNAEWVEITAECLFLFALNKGLPADLPLIRFTLAKYAQVADAYGDLESIFGGLFYGKQ